jgi:hypothetical protein
MSTLETLLAQIIDHKQRLDAMREQSAEMSEALALSDEYHGLMQELREMCSSKPAFVPLPYPIYPVPLWQPVVWNTDIAPNSTLRIIK